MQTNAYSAFSPVGLIFDGHGTRRVVRNLTEAARILLQHWPMEDGEEYIIAVKACVDAINGDISPDEFRQAFLRAAGEAGITAFIVVRETRPPEVRFSQVGLSFREH